MALARSFRACSLHALPTRMLHDGLFDLPIAATPTEIPVRLRLAEGDLTFDLRAFIGGADAGRAYLTGLTVQELIHFCQLAQIRAQLGHGHLFLNTEQPTSLGLSTCYIQPLHRSDGTLVPVIAFNETQPARYKAELVAVLKETTTPLSV